MQGFKLRGKTGIHSGVGCAPEGIIVQQGEVCFEGGEFLGQGLIGGNCRADDCQQFRFHASFGLLGAFSDSVV